MAALSKAAGLPHKINWFGFGTKHFFKFAMGQNVFNLKVYNKI